MSREGFNRKLVITNPERLPPCPKGAKDISRCDKHRENTKTDYAPAGAMEPMLRTPGNVLRKLHWEIYPPIYTNGKLSSRSCRGYSLGVYQIRWLTPPANFLEPTGFI